MSDRDAVDAALIEARNLALQALREITPENTIGPAAGYAPDADGTVSLRFENRLGGYPGWYWTVTVGRADDAEPTVPEAELLPGDGALLAPEWIPWAERLADYQAQMAAEAARREAEGDAEPEDDDDLDDLDDDLDGDDDFDGIDIDQFADADEVDEDEPGDDGDTDDDADDPDDEDDGDEGDEPDDGDLDEDTDDEDDPDEDDAAR